MRRALPALLAVVVAAVAAAGCGGSDNNSVPTKAEYKQQYTELSNELTAVGASVSTALTKSAGKSNKALEKTFGDLADRTRELASKIDDTTPPDDPTIKNAQAALAKGLNTAADDLEAISKAAGKKDLKGAGEAAAKFSRDNAGVANPRVTLNKAVLGITPPKTTTTKPATTNSK